MKKPLINSGLVLFPLFFCVVFAAFAFARPSLEKEATASATVVLTDSLDELAAARSMYDQLSLGAAGLSLEAFENGLKGWDKLRSEGKLRKSDVMAIADFSQSSNEKRLYVLDMENYKMVFHTLVAHGRNSGREWATHFSNKLSSFQSSPGFYVTGQTYHGGNGYSLKLEGVEKGINDQAMRRAIVMHGADYVSERLISTQGYLGRSLGCPAVPVKQAKSIINTLKGGACLYIHVPDQTYASRSTILRDTMG